MLQKIIDELQQIESLNIGEEWKEELFNTLEKVMVEFRERNMKGYVYILHIDNNLYRICKTGHLERHELNEEKLVRVIKAENIGQLEGHLHKKFSNKRITSSQDLFRLNDQDVLYIQMLPDEWEDESRIF